jgi:carbonic anhydrase
MPPAATPGIDRLLERAPRSDGAPGIPSEPALRVVILCCMDARIDPAELFGLRQGDAHVLRNAGGEPTPEMVRALALSQRELGTREVAVVHHTECRALALGSTGAAETSVRSAVDRLRRSTGLPVRDAVRGFVYDLLSGQLLEVGPTGSAPVGLGASGGRHGGRAGAGEVGAAEGGHARGEHRARPRREKRRANARPVDDDPRDRRAGR